MRYGEFKVHCPLMLGETLNEAEALGASVWLWMHSFNHRDAPLHVLPAVLLPVIKRQQYVLVEKEGRPVFFLSWAWMSEEAERRYLNEAAITLPEEDWCNGDRLWFRGALLQRTGRHDSGLGLRLHLFLRNVRRNHLLDYRLGFDPRICGRQYGGRERLVGLFRQAPLQPEPWRD